MSETKKVILSKEKVYALIAEKGKTPAGLSKDFGYNPSYISNIFTNKHKGKALLTTALAIASMLDVTLDDIKADEPVAVEEPLALSSEEPIAQITFDINEVVNSMKDVASAIREFTEVYKELWGTNK